MKTMITKLDLTSTECMPEDRFWKLVAVAGWPSDYNKAKMFYLKLLPKNECMAFRRTLGKAYVALDNLVTDMDLGVGDDGYSDLIYHIIGLGERQYFLHLNNKSLVQKRADASDYKESFAYAIPYDSDYNEDNQFSIKSVIRIAHSCRDEVNKYDKMDTGKRGWNHLGKIGKELDSLRNVVDEFLQSSNEDGLRYLVSEKFNVHNACTKIDKFFKDNYLELPRKFTEDNSFCTAMFENCVGDAQDVLEFLVFKIKDKDLV